MKLWKPIFVENSRIPKLLSYLSPINIGAISLGILVFCRKDAFPSLRRHETIHFQQQLELFFLGFYMLYLFFWLVGIIKYKDGKHAYHENPFEREAKHNQYASNYLATRKRYTWVKYVRDLF
jgi:hypothetical protein